MYASFPYYSKAEKNNIAMIKLLQHDIIWGKTKKFLVYVLHLWTTDP